MIAKGGLKLFGVAGSGKTTTCMNICLHILGIKNDLNNELKNILNEFCPDNINMGDICFTSFSRAAIRSILEKLDKNNIEVPKNHYFRTLNSITWRLCNFDVSNQIKPKELKSFFGGINISYKKEEDSEEKSEAELIVDIYSSLLNTLSRSLKNITNEEIEQYFVDIYSKKSYDINERLSIETVISSLRLYDEWKTKNEKYDYVDSIIRVIENKIDVPCQILIVDEAQDLSNAQTKLIDLWVKELDKDIFIIAGDDDQTVHEWNGAKPDYLIEFNYGNTQTYKLEQSYRLPKNIAMMCDDILKTINYREDKKIYSTKKEGTIIYDPLFNIHNVPQLIEKFCNSGQTNYLLFRTNPIKHQVADYLFTNSNIIFGVLGTNKGRWSKRFLSVCNALNKIMLNKELKQEEVEYLFDVLPTKLCLEHGVKKKIRDSSITKIFKIYEVLEMTKLWKQQKDLLNYDKVENNLKIKEQMIKFLEYVKYKDNNTKIIKMNEIYKDKLNAINYVIEFKEDEEEKVLEYNTMLGTFHAAKGLEADNVFVFLGTSNYFKDINDSEKRCFYVAASRPKDKIFFLGTMSDQKTHLEEVFRDIIRRYRTG